MTFDVTQAFGLAVSVLAFRALPFLAYACASRALRLGDKLIAIFTVAGVGLSLELAGIPVVQSLGRATIEIAYLFCATVAVHTLGERIPTRAAIVMATVLLYVVVPARALPEPFARELATIGFERTLAAYSFFRDAGSKRSDIGEFLFFMLVNPMLVYDDPGVRTIGPPAVRWKASLRCAIGVATIVAQLGLGAWMLGRSSPLTRIFPSPNSVDQWCAWGIRQYAYNLTFYWAHSGLASIQIGMMAFIGYSVPERYRIPILATSPSDFWRRWNTWIGNWVVRYLFTPIGGALRPRTGRRIAAFLAGIAAFTTIGLLHDFAAVLMAPATMAGPFKGFGMTLVFFLAGVTWATWSVFVAGRRRIERKLGLKPGGNRWILACVGWAAFTAMELAMGALAWRVWG